MNIEDYTTEQLKAELKRRIEISKEKKAEEVELIQEQTEDEHWLDVRERAAIAAMGQLIGMGRDDGYKYSPSEVASYAVVYADELIERLKKR